MSAVVETVEDVGDVVGDAVSGVGDAVSGVGDAVSGIVDIVGNVFSGVMEAASDVVDYVAENPWILVAAVAAPFALEALAVEAAAAGTGAAVTTAQMASAFEAGMLADAAALGGGSAAAAGAGATAAGALTAESLAGADAAAGLIPAATPAAGLAEAAQTIVPEVVAPAAAEGVPAAGLSEAAATMAPEVVAPEVVAPEVALADASAVDSGFQLGQFDAALEVPAAQEAVQTGQEILATQGSEVAVADPTQVFGPPAEVDPLEQIISNADTTAITESELAGLTDEELAALQEGTLAAPENVLSEEAVAGPQVTAPSSYGPAEPGFDLNGNPIDDTAWGGIKNLASAYWENPLALAGTAFGVYSGVNLLDKVLSGGNESAANNTSSDVANQTSINEPIKGNPISNVGLRDAYDYSKLSQNAQARDIKNQQQTSQLTPMEFKDFLAASQAQSINPNYVSLEDIQRAAGKR